VRLKYKRVALSGFPALCRSSRILRNGVTPIPPATITTGSSDSSSQVKSPPRSKAMAFDLGGDFTWEEESDEPVVMVAGGIGVTPFRSILLERHRAGKPLNATLLYFNRIEEVPFQTELQKLSNKHPEFTLRIPIGEHITADKILELAPQAKKQMLYLSGPEQMVKSIGSKLHERGI